jgi:microcystin-dependent protein
MAKMRKLILLLSLSFLLWTTGYGLSIAHAAIPRVMNYQGKATDKAGAPLNGNYNLTFRIYNAPTGGAAKWTETQSNIVITNGIFQVQLGLATQLNLPFDESYWVSLEINSDGEMSPRTKLASVPYAYRAEISNNGIPTGVIMAWATDSPPAGWLLCDGSAVSRMTYANLFRIIGATYGAGDGTTTFNLPDLRGRVPVGKSTDLEFIALGQKDGEKTHTLTINEMPAHKHSYTAPVNVSENKGPTSGCATARPSTTDSTGGDGAHNNLQPYITLNYIIKN